MRQCDMPQKPWMASNHEREGTLKFIRSICAAALALGLAAPGLANAQTYPSKTVRIVTPYPAGTGPDTVIRLVAEKLSKSWSQPVIIESKPGGNGGWIAVEYVKKSAPDGYTFVLVDSALFSIHPHLYKKMPYDPMKDFQAVAPIYSTNYFIAVKTDSKWMKVSDIVDSAKASEGRIKYATGGVGGMHHLGSATFESATGTKMTHVPYKDTTQIYVDIASGDIDWAFTTSATAKAFYDSKKVKFLALAAPQRDRNYPDVPTIVEAGGPNMELRTWVGLFAPTGTPNDIVDRVTADIAKVMLDPDVKKKLETIGIEGWSGTAAELKQALDNDYKKFGEVVSKINIEIQ